MKRKKLKTPALYYVIAIILIGVLAFSGYQALRIYLPQSKDRGYQRAGDHRPIKIVETVELRQSRRSGGNLRNG